MTAVDTEQIEMIFTTPGLLSLLVRMIRVEEIPVVESVSLKFHILAILMFRNFQVACSRPVKTITELFFNSYIQSQYSARCSDIHCEISSNRGQAASVQFEGVYHS